MKGIRLSTTQTLTIDRLLNIHSICLTLLFLFPLPVLAEAIGQPDLTIKIGLGTKITQVTINDPEGRTRRVSKTLPTSLYLTDRLNNSTNYLFELYTANYAFEASDDYVGSVVRQSGVRLSFQKNLVVHPYFSPWFGVGFDTSYSQFKKRHTVDDEGFLIARYPNESKLGVALLLNIMQKWTVTPAFDIAAKLEYSAPLNQSVSGFSAGVIFLFSPLL